MPVELTTMITTGLGTLNTTFIDMVKLAVPIGFGIWAIKIGIRVAPGLVKGFIHN